MIKTARARHVGPWLRFTIRTGSGHDLAVDDDAGNTGPRPAELLLAALAGCTAFDVASILTKKRQGIDAYDVIVTGEQRDEPHPHVFERIDVVHELVGPALDTAAVRRSIELSATRYCTATAMLSAGPAEIHHRYVIHRDGASAERGEVVVTGPHADPDAPDSPVEAAPLHTTQFHRVREGAHA
jgi:putative redox protein